MTDIEITASENFGSSLTRKVNRMVEKVAM